jgi:hypothetical protein
MGVGAGQGDVELCSGIFDDGVGMVSVYGCWGWGWSAVWVYLFRSTGTGLCLSCFFNAVTACM